MYGQSKFSWRYQVIIKNKLLGQVFYIMESLICKENHIIPYFLGDIFTVDRMTNMKKLWLVQKEVNL